MLIFVSYRRETDSDSARGIVEVLKERFSAKSVFFDSDSIEASRDWSKEIGKKLESSDLVLVLVGPEWLAAKDEHHRRRIDNEKDWVRKEIGFAIAKDRRLIPVLLHEANLPTEDALPEDISGFVKRQAIRVRRDTWEVDMNNLIHSITRALRMEEQTAFLYPQGYPVKPVPLSAEQISAALEELPNWHAKQREITDDTRVPTGYRGTELVRYFKFKSFLDAIEFMRQTSVTIDAWDHHPKWENTYWNLVVRVTTWDILHQLSDRDIKLARYLENAFSEFPGRDS